MVLVTVTCQSNVKHNGTNCKTQNYKVLVKRRRSKIRQMLNICIYMHYIYILVYITFIPRDQRDVEEDLERKGSLAHPDTRDPWYVNHFIFVKSMYEKHSKKECRNPIFAILLLYFYFILPVWFMLFPHVSLFRDHVDLKEILDDQ